MPRASLERAQEALEFARRAARDSAVAIAGLLWIEDHQKRTMRVTRDTLEAADERDAEVRARRMAAETAVIAAATDAGVALDGSFRFEIIDAIDARFVSGTYPSAAAAQAGGLARMSRDARPARGLVVNERTGDVVLWFGERP